MQQSNRTRSGVRPAAVRSVAGSGGEERYLVLGGNGFVGSYIVDGLVALGKRVRVLDPFHHEPKFLKPKAVEIISGSAFDPLVLDKALKGVTHVIFALAATNPFSADT